MILSLQTFTSAVETMAAGLQGRAGQLVDLSVGSVLRALLESCASVALWMQWLILQVLSMTRAATSSGSDLDSWMGDFSFSRLAGSASSGSVIFSRFTTGTPAFVPLKTAVMTGDGRLSFFVVQDERNPFWSQTAGGYTIPADIASVMLPVQASVMGATGNILPATIALLGSAVPGVDQVSNATSFGGGVDVEDDAAFRARFQLYINTRSLATAAAVASTIAGLQQGARYCILENVMLDGSAAPGNFCVIVDDGAGTTSSELLQAVNANVDLVRPVGTTFSVTPASVLPVAVEMSITVGPTSTATSMASIVEDAVSRWIAILPMGSRVAISKLEALAHDSGPEILSVLTTLINGEASDLIASPGAVFKPTSVNVSVGI